ncbi:aconitate hydratase AcnA [Alteromonas oceanisediminis]|uniref:aconitate hydratase AcnA n=1 Tax=Alteromonas oceanisediminis TaxID=2836180 RepID=UPI001BD9DC2D|nr:aconitate hydratase AcnA [Alteromonas oceanisediminis]MBT0586606.1 aconitate hydratase AcnA [Alteromonas oceanisediminis]
MSKNSFDTKSSLAVDDKHYEIFDISRISAQEKVQKLPFSLKILLENLLRNEDGHHVSKQDIDALINWDHSQTPQQQVAFSPARVVLQDFTGVPAIVDLAAMRDAMISLNGDPENINPQVPVDLVIDHSVMVDYFGTDDALEKNTKVEFERNKERYQFLRWGQKALSNFRVVPPGTGIVHQVNLEYLAHVVMSKDTSENPQLFPDTLVGTDSHTTMINGLGVLGWGVGGIEAEAAMLGQPISMLLPEVVGFKLDGKLASGATATDLVLTVTQMLREKGVVGKFVEFYGDGLANLPLADRATIANMAPEYGATCGIFPVDDETLTYLRLSGRTPEQVDAVEAYAKKTGLWRKDGETPANYTDTLALDLGDVVPSIAGPKRPQDRISLSDAKHAFIDHMQLQGIELDNDALNRFADEGGDTAVGQDPSLGMEELEINGEKTHLKHGDVVIAAITSCTNTSNPAVMLAAGLVAQKAIEKGLKPKPWVKTSLAPGSQVVPAYLEKANLLGSLKQLGFDVVGFGCTTCIGNSGPLPDAVSEAIRRGQLTVSSVLSGNRNFEGRIHQDVRANYLASPPLVVAYALAGTMTKDLTREPIGYGKDGEAVMLEDIWPTPQEVSDLVSSSLSSEMYSSRYQNVFEGTEQWKSLPVPEGKTYSWPESSYVKNPPFFDGIKPNIAGFPSISDARCIVKVGDSITTDHISPAGAIQADSPVGRYLQQNGVSPKDFNSLGSRRGNHEVMMRGTFANTRLRNQLAPGTEGGLTRYFPDDKVTSIYDAAMKYQSAGTQLVVLAGKEYGTGSSRDWAAKGTKLLGIEVVLAESFERIHRSNLVGFGVLPLEFMNDDSAETLGLDGTETFQFGSVESKPKVITVDATKPDGSSISFEAKVRIDTESEWDYYQHGGILHYVLRDLASKVA